MSGWAGAQNLHAESGKAIHYSGMTDCFRRTIQEEGYRALFKVALLLFVVFCLLTTFVSITEFGRLLTNLRLLTKSDRLLSAGLPLYIVAISLA